MQKLKLINYFYSHNGDMSSCDLSIFDMSGIDAEGNNALIYLFTKLSIEKIQTLNLSATQIDYLIRKTDFNHTNKQGMDGFLACIILSSVYPLDRKKCYISDEQWHYIINSYDISRITHEENIFEKLIDMPFCNIFKNNIILKYFINKYFVMNNSYNAEKFLIKLDCKLQHASRKNTLEPIFHRIFTLCDNKDTMMYFITRLQERRLATNIVQVESVNCALQKYLLDRNLSPRTLGQIIKI